MLINSGVYHEIQKEKVLNAFDICGAFWIKHFCLRQFKRKQREFQGMPMTNLL